MICEDLLYYLHSYSFGQPFYFVIPIVSIGNLDEKVSERVLYEILIQVGRVVDLYIPRDKETNRHKGYAFAEYESEEIADYAVRLFSGLVRLHNKTLKFAVRCLFLPWFYLMTYIFHAPQKLKGGYMAIIDINIFWDPCLKLVI